MKEDIHFFIKKLLTNKIKYDIIKAQKKKRYDTMMRTAETYLKEEMNIEMPKGEINGSWFAENDLPMIVCCTCCDTSMALPSAMIDDDGTIYCSSCAE